jgi:hypothetical protein
VTERPGRRTTCRPGRKPGHGRAPRADNPLLFGPRLAAQYEIARHAHGFADADLADLARMSVLAGIDNWLIAA